MHISKKNILLTFMIFCLCSCRDEFTICELSTDVKIKTGLYENVSGVEREAAVSNVSITKIGGTLPGKNETDISKFDFELEPEIDSAQYKIIITSGTLSDTIIYAYSSQKVNLSIECGDIFIHHLSEVITTNHFIDSVVIANSMINTASVENVKIYF